MKQPDEVIAFETMCDERTVPLFESWVAGRTEPHDFLSKLTLIKDSHVFRLGLKVETKEDEHSEFLGSGAV